MSPTPEPDAPRLRWRRRRRRPWSQTVTPRDLGGFIPHLSLPPSAPPPSRWRRLGNATVALLLLASVCAITAGLISNTEWSVALGAGVSIVLAIAAMLLLYRLEHPRRPRL